MFCFEYTKNYLEKNLILELESFQLRSYDSKCVSIQLLYKYKKMYGTMTY